MDICIELECFQGQDLEEFADFCSHINGLHMLKEKHVHGREVISNGSIEIFKVN